MVNNPFMWSADDKFFGATLATSLGLASPKTVVLPNKEYVPGIVHSESLRNLTYPLDWLGIVEYVGLPCILKDAHGGGWKEVYVCHSLEELIHHYDGSARLQMVVQEFIEWEHFVRCLAIGQEEVLPMKYDPKQRRYLVEHDHLTPALGNGLLSYADGAATSNLTTFGASDGTTVPHIAGYPTRYMRVPAFSNTAHGYHVTLNGSTPNGGGAYINQFTIIFDLLIPAPLGWTPLFNTNPQNANDADFFVDANGRAGIGAIGYSTNGAVTSNAWHRSRSSLTSRPIA